jgi:hypothetical protein
MLADVTPAELAALRDTRSWVSPAGTNRGYQLMAEFAGCVSSAPEREGAFKLKPVPEMGTGFVVC